MPTLLQDIRFGLRMLAKDRGFTAVVVLALALGIGANATVFTIVNAVLFKGLPFDEGHRIMHLSSNNLPKGRERLGVSYPDFRDWKAQARSFKDLAAFSGIAVNLSDRTSTPERYSGARMTANSFSLIGQKPVLGRDFSPDEEKPGAAAVALLGYGMWESRYGRDPGVIGKTIRVNEAPTVVIGVMPKGLRFPVNSDMWFPLIPTAEFEKRDNRNLGVFGRLADNVELAAARVEMDTVAKRLQKEYAKSNEGIGAVVKPYNDEFNGGRIRNLVLTLLGAVGFVLLIACANVANLLLARSLARTKEISIRSALGASRWRVVRQLLVESVLLGVFGGIAGLLIAIWGSKAFDRAVANMGKPYWIDFSMDFTVFAYLAAICVTTGLLFGLVPSLQASRLDINETLKESGRGHSGGARGRFFSGFLVVTELALALVLLVGAGLMIRSFLNLYGMSTGVEAKNVITMRLNLVNAKYPARSDLFAFEERLRPRLQAIPGVEVASVSSNLPMAGSFGWEFEVEGQPPVEKEKRPSVSGLIVSPEYFQAIGLRVLQGRALGETDGVAGKEAVVVNQRFASKHWSNQDPLGKRLRLIREGAAQPWMTVVGLVPDVRQNDPSRVEPDPLIYVPFRQDPIRGFAIVARTRVAPGSLVAAFRKEVQAIDEDLPVFAPMTLEESFAQQRWPFFVFGTLLAIFAVIALVLSSVGIYAVMAYSVSQRTQEIGVRIALGASAGSILGLVLSKGLKQLAIGLVVGLAGAYGLTRVLSTILVQVSPTDPVTFVSLSVLLTAVALLACWLPARRAMKVDPVVALRYE